MTEESERERESARERERESDRGRERERERESGRVSDLGVSPDHDCRDAERKLLLREVDVSFGKWTFDLES